MKIAATSARVAPACGLSSLLSVPFNSLFATAHFIAWAAQSLIFSLSANAERSAAPVLSFFLNAA